MEEGIEGKCSKLSAGWRTRCIIACALFQDCDILLLDECTNFLDLPAIIWPEEYVKGLNDRTVVGVRVS